tara:strand:- start:38 stop:406 length:369 start_codon:yes stop_codon:yes gene_type:complete
MSTLKVTNIQATGETASRAVSGVAAAWVNFNGTGTVAVRNSSNVSSLTDVTSGTYSVNFASSMSAADFAISGVTAPVAAQDLDFYTDGPQNTASLARVYNTQPGISSADAGYMLLSIHGDLA